jgi:exodeoxyribonuclease VII small subunit
MSDTPPTASDPAEAPRRFEEALARLETIVRQLEREEFTLEDTLRLFREGMELYRYCSRSLEEARQTVDALLGGESSPRPWSPPESD